jgi:hypothetical protein
MRKDVSEGDLTFIFMIEYQPILPTYLLHAGFLLNWFSILKMEVIRSTKTSVYVEIARHYILQDGNIQAYFCFNKKDHQL